MGKRIVATGGYLGNRCIYLEKACYTLVVTDKFGDGNAGFKVSLEQSDGSYLPTVNQLAYEKKTLETAICTVAKDCATLVIEPDDYKEDTTWKITDKESGKEVE